jgi:gliding motility-associated-like protein
VGSPPNASFTISSTTVCAGDVIQIIDTTPESNSVDTWHYSGDHNMLFSCQDEPNPQVSFNSQTGTSTITMTAGFRGCYSTATQEINVNGPIGKLSYSCNCDSPFTYPFTANISDATHWTFDFGDGQSMANTTSTTVSHTYNSTGDYWVTLTSYNTNSGCAPHIDSVLVKVRNVQAVINLPDVICKEVDFHFDATASIDGASQEGSCHNSFIWDFGDNTPPKTTNGIYTRKYEQSGYFTVELFAEDINGCMDSTSKLIRVAGVDADFNMTYNGICLPLTVNLQAQATGDLNITSYNWYYNDQTSSTGQTSAHTFTDPIYNSTGQLEYFYVTLEVIDEAGCITTVKDSVMSNIPNSNFQNLTPVNICEGGSVTFKPLLSQTGNQFQWNFGDGSTSTSYQVNHSFEHIGFYTISLTTTNSSGCSYTKVMENMIHVQDKPIAGFMASIPDDETICYPAQLTFTDTSIVNPFGSRTWNLGNGAPSIGSASIGANYNEPGLYTVTLISRTTAGCADTIAKTIQVEGPLGNFNLSPTTICRGKSIQLAISDTSDVATWQWDYGDGTHGGQVNQHAHQYDFDFNPASSQTVVSLVLWNADSTCNAVISKNVNFVDARAGFKRNNELTALDSIHCYGIADIFTNTSTSNITQWQWNFGNGQTHNGMIPPPVTYQPGTYSVQLAVRTAVNPGCVDTLQKTMIIHPLPVVQTTGGAICLGDAIQIFADGGVSYAWSPTETLSDAHDQNPIAFPDITTTYTVSVTDDNDCVNTETTTVVVYQPIQTVTDEYSIIIGESYLLNAYQGEGYTYQWSPNYNISCLDCAEVWVMPMYDTTYRVIITDLLGCYTDTSYYHVKVLPWTSVDVPDIFTPNGDGINDIIYVRGWGIEKLHFFKIFNRWGELVFESNDINHGWNGYYKDKLQMADTYSYIASVKYYLKEAPEEKSGFINIVR